MNIITGKSKSNGLLNFLFKHGHPICISNRSDPFCATNINDTLAVLRILAQQPNGIFFQTKGGVGIDDALDILRGKRDVVFYITITTIRDDISSRMEPGAPLPGERIKLAKDLKKNGYEVIIAINPCFEPWMPESDLIDLEENLLECGISHYVFQRLKVSWRDIKSFSPYRISQFSDDEMKKATEKTDKYFQFQVERQIAKGLNTVAFGMPYKTGFFKSIHASLPRSLNNLYSLINNLNEPREVRFEEYRDVMLFGSEHLLSFSGLEIPKYILNQNRAVWKNPKRQKIRMFEQLLNVFWNDNGMSASPQNNFLFRVITDGGNPIVDNDGNIVLWHDGEIHRKPRTFEITKGKEVTNDEIK